MAKRKARRKQRPDNRTPPTPEQQRKGEFRSAGMAYKRIPVIETMLNRGQINAAQYDALSYYASQAHLADKSPIKSNLDRSVSGGDFGISAAIASAAFETSRMERDMGALWPIARAIAVDEKTLTQWCIEKHGGREKETKSGVIIVPVSELRNMRNALLELKFAASRLMGLDARR